MAGIIETGINISDSGPINSKYDFHLIGVGESCFYVCGKALKRNIRYAALQWGARHGVKVVTRSARSDGGIEGLRVWVVAS